MIHEENRRYHQVPVVWSFKRENENFRGGPHLSEYISTFLVACVQVKLSTVKVRSIFCENKFIERNTYFLSINRIGSSAGISVSLLHNT